MSSRRLGQEAALNNIESVNDEDLSIVDSDEGSTGDSQASGVKDSNKAQPADVVRGETRTLNRLRYILLFLLLGGGVLFSTGTWLIVSDADEESDACDDGLSATIDGMTFALQSSCQEDSVVAGFDIDGGPLDLDVSDLDDGVMVDLPTDLVGGTGDNGTCTLRLTLIPANVGSDSEDRNRAPAFTSIVVVVYFLTICVFMAFDYVVEKRQSIVVNIATKSSAIVENLFPAQVRDRMMQETDTKKKKKQKKGEEVLDPGIPDNEMYGNAGIDSPNQNDKQVSVKQFLNSGPAANNDLSTQPIADLVSNRIFREDSFSRPIHIHIYIETHNFSIA